ncbi:MAG: VCBS repeat-containing protein [Armatimonadota bacterium]|nr:VCBS repeat-containing protein [Armatimonadota bacterium]
MLLLLFLLTSPRRESVADAPASDSVTADLDRDGRAETIRIGRGEDPALSVWRGSRCVHRWLPARWKPWKVAVADMEGDGRLEILVGVFKSTRFIPQPHQCLFVYGWNGREAFPKWLGSSMGRPFDDFVTADLNGDGADEVVVRAGNPGRRWVMVYAWRGFGFAVERQHGPWTAVSLLKTRDGRVVASTPRGRFSITLHQRREDAKQKGRG